MRRFLVIATVIVFVGLNSSGPIFAAEEGKEELKQKVEEVQEPDKQAREEMKGQLEDAKDTEQKKEAVKEGEEKLEEAAE